jgi:carbon monoxide dehydrogenase subunit G
MTGISEFESRTGQVSCNQKVAFGFFSDIRNFNRFIQTGVIHDWHSDAESCTFEVSQLGKVQLRIIEKEPFGRVVFSGDALQQNEFTITLNIKENGNDNSKVKVDLKAELNPLLKMVIARPIEIFLEKLIDEMEGFNGWGDNNT